jgi:hypothetical protein
LRLGLGAPAHELIEHGDAKPRRSSWRDLPAAELAAQLLATPTIADSAWADEPRLPRETRTAFIRRVLLGEMDPWRRR